ncbi:MAG: lipopolysaccharide heptosyltransferase [Verrucomicrobiales bacterium]|nr:lipopolysaccharide heptosyltransferase [Verrucomicrobiales bacterium]
MAFALSEFYQQTKSARKIIVVDFGFLGDSVHFIPALWEIKRNYPQAEIHTLSAELGAEVLKLAPCVDRAWGFPLGPKSPPWWRGFGLLQKLRNEHFDLAINFSGADRTIFVTRFMGAKWRVGQQGARKHFWAKWLIPHWVPRQTSDVIVSEQRRRMLGTLGMSLQAPRFDLTIPDDAKHWAAHNMPGRCIHFSLNASSCVKEWPVEHWIELANKLLTADVDLNIVATASAKQREQERVKAFVDGVQSKRVIAITSATIPQLAALLQRCSLQVGGDSGVSHLAYAVGTPTFSFLRDYPAIKDWMLTGEKHRQIVVACDCINRRENVCELSGTSKCLAAITPDHATAIIRKQLAR